MLRACWQAFGWDGPDDEHMLAPFLRGYALAAVLFELWIFVAWAKS